MCVARNKTGQSETIPVVLNVRAKRAVNLDTQFPEGTEGVHQLQELEEHWSEMLVLLPYVI